MADPLQVPKAMFERYQAITALTDRVCAEILNDEYAELARRLTAALARKRPSPLENGTVAVWACSIVYTLGRINFLYDPEQRPHLSADALCAPFKVSPRTAAAKSKTIIDLLNLIQMDPRWTLPSLLADNPHVWMVQTANGLIVDLRTAPRELQEEAYRQGIIPYIPADRG